jgi:hypothetical protein
MSRQLHDQLAKDLMEELLSPLGEVKINRQLRGEVRYADVTFTPRSPTPDQQAQLGLLGRLTREPFLIEAFHSTIDIVEIRNCLQKLFSLHAQLHLKAKGTPAPEAELPRLWLLLPSVSAEIRKHSSVVRKPSWEEGIYLSSLTYKLGFVVIHQLPKTEDTLWLRLMGRGRVQKRAIQEFLALPKEHPYRQNITDILANWRVTLDSRKQLTDDEEERLMNLSPAYLRHKEELVQQGASAERQATIESLLTTRFGKLDKKLAGIVESLLKFPLSETMPLLLQASREDLLQQFGKK